MQYSKKILSYELLIHKGSPFELHDMTVGGITCKVFPRGPQTLRDVFMKAAVFADREFIVKDDTRLLFGQAFSWGNDFARYLRWKYGIKKGSRVALVMKTCPEWAIAFMSLCFAGAVPVVIPAEAEGYAIYKAIEVSNCELTIADFHTVRKISVSEKKCPVVVPVARRSDALLYVGELPGLSIFSFSDAPIVKGASGIKGASEISDIDESREAMSSEAVPDNEAAPDSDDEALISFTSGTTGEPKGVIHSHRNMTTGLMNMMLGGMAMSFRASKDGRKRSNDVQPHSLLLSPFSHIGGYSHLLLMSYLGGKIVLMPEWDLRRASALIESESVRSLSGFSPAMAAELLRFNRATDCLRSLTNLNIHGAAPQMRFIREIADEFPQINLTVSYGMTETCGAISVVSGKELLDEPQLAGRLLPSVMVKIVEQDGREAAIGSSGEIYARGAMVMRGYCCRGGDSVGILRDGWLKTGDMGYVDSAGNLYVTGRMDKVGFGKKLISSGELERMLCEMEWIDEAAVIEIPNIGRRSGILVTIIPNRTRRISECELEREVIKVVSEYSDDIHVSIMSDIPRTASGKADRSALRLQLSR